jgi:uncharacterized C2H2 Zn-finger protein
MRETALGEIMSEPPTRPIVPLAPAPPKVEQEWQCPDCDRTFKSPQGLGAHRSRSHGYRRNGKATAKTIPSIEALIESIFPDGIPANREVLTALLDFMKAYETLENLA